MCGRTACTLTPDEICKSVSSPKSRNNQNNAVNKQSQGNSSTKQRKATNFKCNQNSRRKENRSIENINKKQEINFEIPTWIDHPGDYQYTPSVNVAPTRFTPVMCLDQTLRGVKRSVDDEKVQPKRIIQPMMWGLIPPFFKGSSAKEYNYKTNNCRIESIKESKLYRPSIKRGKRCVVLVDGFYEWQTSKTGKSKQPYFVYSNQDKPEVKVWDRSSWNSDNLWSEEEGWRGPQMLKMAGLFSKWTSEDNEEIFSYTVLTMGSKGGFSSIHDRVPVILSNEEEIDMWLNPEVDYEKALDHFNPDPKVSYHPVSSQVNNSRNKESDINNPVDPKIKVETSSSKFMTNWLNSSKDKRKDKQKYLRG